MKCPTCAREWPDEFKVCPICAISLRAEMADRASGAIAQGESVAAGEQGVAVGQGVQGDVIAAGGIKEVYQYGDAGSAPGALRRSYLDYLLEKAGRLFLSGIDHKTASDAETRLELGAVYTALLTLASEERDFVQQRRDLESVGHEVRRLSALAQLDRHERLVLLGEPGSGKSTFVRFVAACLAGEALGREDANLARLTEPLPQDEQEKPAPQPWSHGALLPVQVVLRDFAARGLPPAGTKASAKHLCDFIAGELDGVRLGEYVPHLEREMREKGGLLLLDGLDEVPEADRRREQIKQAVIDFGTAFPRCRILVTSRTYAYQQQAWRLPGFTEAVLAPFGDGQIQRFVERWYAHIAALRGTHTSEAERRAALLKRAISRSDRLRGLAERPLLLTLMASLHAWRGGSLPEKREELYADTVDLLLDWWEGTKTVEGQQLPSLSEWLRVDRDRVRELLDELAYKAHTEQPDLVRTADVPEGDLLGGLMRLSRNPDVNLVRLVDYLSLRAGLLLPRGVGVYTFPHRTFQEYLAACYLTDHDYPEQVAGLARKEPNRWREVALLAGAKSARGSDFALWALVEALCFRDLTPGEPQDEVDAWGASLAGQALVESTSLASISERNVPKVARVKAHLVRVLQEGRLPAEERVQVGATLGTLGDPRSGVGLRPDGLPDIAWCEVPGGPFTMGSPDDSLAWGKETPQHSFALPAFQIARYPVTNAQYTAFVQDGGYTRHWRVCWTDAGWEWKGERTAPAKAGGVFDLPNHPVVAVSWYECTAFCRWLTARLRGIGEIGRDEAVTLPSEAQWEKAARGTDGRVYPWGDEIDPGKANYQDTGIGETSAVGCFPGGASPYGVQDLSGNVWEWCATKWQDGYEGYQDDNDAEGSDARVLRGGAFGNESRLVRCASRYGYTPGYGRRDRGCRVVLSPGFPSDL